jgi:integrase
MRYRLISVWRRAACLALDHLTRLAAHWSLTRLRALLLDAESDQSLITGFLLGYGDRTRAAYLADLRDFHAWCARIGIGLLAAHRSHIEAYIRALEQAGRSRATVARRLATLAGFYRYAVQEGALPPLPRRPHSSPLGDA